MFKKPCSICAKRLPGKLATAYNAWFNANETRVAWKQRICADCLLATYVEVLQKCSEDSTEPTTCIGCGGSLVDDLDPVFMTLYLPKSEPKEFELAVCVPCADSLKATMQQGAEPLEDRSGRRQGPSTSPSDPFANLGI